MALPKRSVGRPENGNLKALAQANDKKMLEFKEDFVPVDVRYQPMPPKTASFRCCMCGSEYKRQTGNFLSGGKSPLWQANNGFIPICKTCCESLMENYTSFYNGNEEHALRRMCQIFDWFYDTEASSMTMSQSNGAGKTRVYYYPSKLGIKQISTKGTTYLDTIKKDIIASRKIYDDPNAPVKQFFPEKVEEFKVTKEMIRTWGSGFTPDEYRYLEEEYADWTSKNVCNTKSQEELYHNIVLAQLDIRRARQSGGKVAEAQKTLQDLMNSANILPRQTADNIIADTQTFGTLLKKYEETDPIPEPDERWKDVDGIRKYVNTWFRGGLAKAVKINGIENVKLYDEAIAEMEKYTVYPPDKSSPANIENKTAIFDVKEQDGNEQ